LSIYFENIWLPNDLIIIRNQEDDEEDVGEIFRGIEDQHGHPIQVGDQSNSKFQSLTSNPTRSPGLRCIQIDSHDAYKIGFGCCTHAQKQDEMNYSMAALPSPNKIRFEQDCQNKFNF
jgi:hypothetical protein